MWISTIFYFWKTPLIFQELLDEKGHQWRVSSIILKVHVPSRFSCVWLFVTPQTVAPRLSWPWSSPGKNTGVVAVHLSRGSSQPRARACVYYGSCTAGRFFTTEPPGKALEGTLLLYFKYLASLDCTYYHWSKNTKYWTLKWVRQLTSVSKPFKILWFIFRGFENIVF